MTSYTSEQLLSYKLPACA